MFVRARNSLFDKCCSVSAFIISNRSGFALIAIGSVALYLSLKNSHAFGATGFVINGNDESQKLTDMNDLVATVVGWGQKYLAPALAFVCVLNGVHRCAKKRYEEGVPLILGGVGLVFIGRLLDTISKLFS